MANTTVTAAAVTTNDTKVVSACGGPAGARSGASIKAFTVTAGTGNYPLAGLTVDLSSLFPTKVLMAVVGPLHDPAKTTGDLAALTVYVPSATGDPAAGKIYCYTHDGNAGLPVSPSDDNITITGYVCHGFAIGY